MLSTRRGVLSVLVAALLFSTSGAAQKVAGEGSTPLGVGAGRLLVGALVLIAVMPWLGHDRRDVVRAWRRPLVLVATLGATAFQVTFFAGVREAGIALGTLIVVGSAPVWAGILGWVFLRHRPVPSWVVATAVCIIGLTLLSWDGISGGSATGVAFSLIAGLSIASYTVAAKRLLEAGMAPVIIMSSTFALGSLVLLPLLATQPLAWLATPRGIALVVWLGVVTMALANWMHVRGLRVLGPAPVTTLMLAEPLLATLLGVAFFGERLAVPALAGLALVLVGLVMQGTTLARSRTPDMPSAVAPT